MADVVSVKRITEDALGGEVALHSEADRRLSSARQAGEPDGASTKSTAKNLTSLGTCHVSTLDLYVGRANDDRRSFLRGLGGVVWFQGRRHHSPDIDFKNDSNDNFPGKLSRRKKSPMDVLAVLSSLSSPRGALALSCGQDRLTSLSLSLALSPCLLC